jgi:hypothetical protein
MTGRANIKRSQDKVFGAGFNYCRIAPAPITSSEVIHTSNYSPPPYLNERLTRAR